MIRIRHSFFLFSMFALALSLEGLVAPSASAQVATGTPPFGSFSGGPDVINLANLNAHWTIPVLHKPGRGTNFSYDLSYDSSVWYPVGSSGNQSWRAVANWGWRGQTEVATGYVSYSTSIGQCFFKFHLVNVNLYSNFVYHDKFGVAHFFAMPTIGPSCYGASPSASATATDGSGYQIYATNSPSATITSSGGTVFNPPLQSGSGSGNYTDRNGNVVSVDGSGNFYDTLSSTTPVLTVAGLGTPSSPTTFTYTVPSGGATVQMNFTQYTVNTYFHISGIAEYGRTSVPLVSSIVLPDNSQYTFTYEATPSGASCTPLSGTTSCVTGRIASVTVPTGGQITYSYSGGSDGILSDGSAATLTRTTPDGTWTYAQVKGSGAASTTTVTAPQLPYDSAANQTIIQFQGIYETQRQVYQGSTSGTLLSTINTCYNATTPPATTPCTGTAVTLPISNRTTIATIPGSGNLQSQHLNKYDSYGNVTESDDYDLATAAPFPLLRQTLITYAALGGNLNAFPQTVTVKDGSGTIKSRQDTNYDQYTSFTGGNCITGASQHNDTSYSCTFTARANATASTTYTDPVTPGGAITKNFTYDSLGNLRTAQLNCCQLKTWNYSATTQYAYPDSIVSGSSSPTLTTQATYDLHMGLVLTSTDPNNVVTTLTYDNLGRPLTAKTGSNPTTNYTYNDYDNHSSFTPWTVQVCSPVQGTNTACQKSILDKLGRSVTAQLLDGSSTLYSAGDTQYDVLGRPYKASNPYTTSASYWTETDTDALGRVLKTILPDNSSSTAAYTDNTVTVTDSAGKKRKSVTDGAGRLITVTEPDSSNNLTQNTSYTYTVLDALATVTEGSQTRTYSYDALGRLLSTVTPEGGTTCFGTLSGSTCQANGYDSYNNLLYRTDARGVVTNYLYDTLNRPVGVSYPTVPSGVSAMPNVCKVNGSATNNANVCLAYGTTAASYNNGRAISTTDPSGSESYTYDQFGNVTQLAKIIGTTTYTTNYTYNLANELTQITYPSGRVVVQSVDAIGRLCAVGATGSTCSTGATYATSYGYNSAQQLTGFNYGNGVAASFGYSTDGRLQLNSISYAKSGTTLFGLAYSYGAAGSNNGQIQSITDSVDNGRSIAYTYDMLSRLSTAVTTGSTTYPAWGLSMTYDRYGNRSAQNVSSGCTGITCPSNSLAPDPATNRITGDCYDANGNLLAESAPPCPSPTYTYDAENRMVNYSSAAYTYDGNGLRVSKVSGSTTTVYVFSGSKVIAEYDNGAAVGSPSREYIYSGSTLLAKIDSSGTKYYHQDHLSNRLVTDSIGNTVAQLGHFPFGESWYNASGEKLLFTSYERDSESGNDYAMARYDINRVGRFASPDPLSGSTGDPQSLNRYAYVENDPIDFLDPTGQLLMGPRGTPGGPGTDPSNPFDPTGDGSVWSSALNGMLFNVTQYDFSASLYFNWADYGLSDLLNLADEGEISLDAVTPLGIMGFFRGGPGRGNSSGDQRQKQIQATRSTLYDALLNDPDCLSFLAGRGGMPLGTLGTISINHDYIGGQSIQAQTNNAGPDPTALVPRNPSITINDNGAFFTKGLVASDGTRSGTPLLQGSTLLHELGHATGVLLQDGQGIPNAISNQATNTAALKQHCAKTLASLPNK
jgi:RHS repeat-associated protein